MTVDVEHDGRKVDLRSDTLTKPSASMRQVMATAEVGDDVYGEDPTVAVLEQKAAELLGFEAGVFVTSGTQGNLVALLSHTQRGQEVILERDAHIYYYEVAGMAALGGLQAKTVAGEPGSPGYLSPATIEAAIREQNIHYPETGLICLENTHNRGGGAVTSVQQMADMVAVAEEHGIPVHLDGARVFNAAAALNVPVRDVVKGLSSVQFCLSKGLGAPIGSVVVGSEAMIQRARKWRKMLGGGMRQVGIVAAAGLYALENNVARLADDNARATELSLALQKMKGIQVVAPDITSNIVIFNTEETGENADQWIAKLAEHGVICGSMGTHLVRFVTHLDVDQDDVNYVIKVLQALAS